MNSNNRPARQFQTLPAFAGFAVLRVQANALARRLADLDRQIDRELREFVGPGRACIPAVARDEQEQESEWSWAGPDPRQNGQHFVRTGAFGAMNKFPSLTREPGRN
jgi:hypothetical protein